MARSDGVQAATTRPQRADARRNAEAILDAAIASLTSDPDVSIADVATAAGVGRVTLYSHFSNRAELVDAALVRTIERADQILNATDTTGDPVDALTRLIVSSWQIVHQFRNVLLAAQRELPPDRIRSVHDRALRRVQTIIERGQRGGVFRTDLPRHWLITTAVSLMHAAAEGVAAGNIKVDKAPEFITATVLAAFTPPATTVSVPHD